MQKEKSKKQSVAILFLAALILGISILSGASSVQAAAGLDMSTSYPGVTAKAGDTVSFDLDFTSLTGESYDASLSAVSIPEGWEGTFTGSDRTISKIHIDGNAVSSSDSTADSSAASFDLSIPDDAADGTYAVALKADAGSGVEDTLNLEIIVSSEAAGQGNFTSEYAEQQGSTGTTFSFDTTLINNRGTEQSYSLSSSAPSGWSVSYTPSSSEDGSQVASVTVDAESSEGLTVTVTPPENVEQGEYTISCTATSANESLTTDLIVEITGTYGVSLSAPAGNLNADAYAGSETSITLSITNTGNVDLTDLELSSSLPTDWEVTFDESSIDTLEAGATTEVTAYLTPSSDAITGDYVSTLTVGNDQVSSDAEFRISVKTQTAWGIVAVVIIAALIVALRYIFKKYGRR